MKVLLVDNSWRSTSVQRYMSELLDNYKKMKKNVEMIYLESKFPLNAHDRRIKTIKTPFRFPVGMGVLNNYFYFPKKIPQGYDVYHILNQTIARCCKDVKHSVITCHDIFTYTFKKEDDMITSFLVKQHLKFLKKTDKIIAISDRTKRDLVNILKIPEKKIEVIHYGVDTDQFKPRNKLKIRKKLNLPLDKKIILHVGKDNTRKNVATLIKAFHEIEKKIPDVMLMRVSGISDRSRDLIKKLNLEHKVKVSGIIDTDKIHEFYNAADLFVFPSLYEGFGFPPLEAMASGIPVITSNAGSLPEVVGNSGIIMPPKDVNRLAKAMYEVLTNNRLSNNLKKRGLKRVKRFGWKEIAKRTWKVYESVGD